jgi:ribosomal-protein-alanine N-acetyltransferase
MNFKENYTQNEISLKLTDESHINKLLDYSLTKKFYRYLEYKPFKKKEAEIYFKKKIKSKKIILFSIFYKKKIIGTFSINNYSQKSNECLIGYGINPKFWGKGIFNRLITLAINKIFIKKGQKINVITRNDNFSSIAGLIKNNFIIMKKLDNFYYDKKTKKKYDAFKLQWIKN